MELHLATSVPDWASVPADKRSGWQRLAAQTKGVVTPGNITSVTGLLLVFAGLSAMLKGYFWPGLGLLSLGRICDLIDGGIAHKTGTKSPLGEGFDATCDKIGALVTLIVFAAANWLWWPAAVLIGLQNFLNSIVGLIGRQRHYHLHPLFIGKVATAGEWVALLGFGFVAALGKPHYSSLGLGAYAMLSASLVLGAFATGGYLRAFLAQQER